MQVVAPADTDISSWGIEVAVGVPEGLPFDGVLRFAFPSPGFTPCTWLTTLSRDDLIERAGAAVHRQAQRDRRRTACQRAKDGVDPGRGSQAQRERIPSVGGLRQTEKERTPTLTKVDLVRTTDGPRRPSNKITIYGRSTKPRRSASPTASAPCNPATMLLTGMYKPGRVRGGEAGG